MPGFPTRPTRLAFGPMAIQNRFPVRDPVKEGGAELFKLLYWQMSGAGVVVPMAVACIDPVGPSLLLSAEAWDPDGGSVPTVTTSGPGQYALEYAAQYPDYTGTMITTNLQAARANVQTLSDIRAVAEVQPSRRNVEVRVFDSAGPFVDAVVMVEMY